MALTKVGPAGIGSTPGTGYVIGDSFLHSTGLNATNAYYTGIVTAQTFRVLGNFQVDGTTTTLDTEITSVDKLEVAANNTTVGVAITQSGSGDILNLYDGSTEVFSVADGGNVFIGNNADRTSFLNASSNNLQIDGGVIFEPGSGNDVEIYNYRTTAIKIGTGGAEKVRIASDGKVGIGTAIPAQKLHVFGNTGTNIQIEQTSGNIYLGSSGNTRFGLSSGANLIQSTSVDFAIGSFDGNSLIFGTNNFERFRITSDGKVGIGTDNPGAILEVFDATSNTIINVKSGDAGAVLNLIDNSARSSIEQNGTTLKISSDTAAEDADSDIRLQVDGSSKMIIRNSGDVVTGVPGNDNQNNTGSRTVFTVADITNGALLHVRGQSPAIFFDQSSGGIGKVFLDNADFAIQSGTPASEGTERLRITSTGNVGISSTVPKTDLDISQKTGAVALPQGTTAQRPTGSAPYIRKNTTNNALEYFDGTSWVEIITDYFPTGSTILG